MASGGGSINTHITHTPVEEHEVTRLQQALPQQRIQHRRLLLLLLLRCWWWWWWWRGCWGRRHRSTCRGVASPPPCCVGGQAIGQAGLAERQSKKEKHGLGGLTLRSGVLATGGRRLVVVSHTWVGRLVGGCVRWIVKEAASFWFGLRGELPPAVTLVRAREIMIETFVVDYF
jgi:hypothetical protein